MTKTERDKLRKLWEKAPPGEWFWDSYSTISSSGSSGLPLGRRRIPGAVEEEPETTVCHVPTIAGDTSTPEGADTALLIEASRQLQLQISPEILEILENE